MSAQLEHSARPLQATIYRGDALEVLRSLPSDSIHCCVTSPPYFGLRDYGLPPSVWGGSRECQHDWSLPTKAPGGNGDGLSFRRDKQSGRQRGAEGGAYCSQCGAWRGCLGLEPSLAEYVAHMVELFEEVRRVLRSDGICWLNLGDSFANDSKWGGATSGKHVRELHGSPVGRTKRTTGLGPKNLAGIPWRVAFALQDAGWVLRSDVIEEVELYCPCGCGYVLEERIWRYSQDREVIFAKRNVMPESVKDRPTRAHEYVFLLTKSPTYYYDAHAIREPMLAPEASTVDDRNRAFSRRRVAAVEPRQASLIGEDDADRDELRPRRGSKAKPEYKGSRNKRSVWRLATQPFGDAHFATFPKALVEPCVLSGSSERGACPACLAPYRRLVEPSPEYSQHLGKDWANYELDDAEGRGHFERADGSRAAQRPIKRNAPSLTADYTTVGWAPGCDCDAGEPVPCVILDPFSGAGTTGLVALETGRSYVGIELNASYAAMSEQRMRPVSPLLADVTVKESGEPTSVA